MVRVAYTREAKRVFFEEKIIGIVTALDLNKSLKKIIKPRSLVRMYF